MLLFEWCFNMYICVWICREYTSWEDGRFWWRVRDRWAVFQRSWPCVAEMVSARRSCNKPQTCSTHKSLNCLLNSTGRLGRMCSFSEMLLTCTWILLAILELMVRIYIYIYVNPKLYFLIKNIEYFILFYFIIYIMTSFGSWWDKFRYDILGKGFG